MRLRRGGGCGWRGGRGWGGGGGRHGRGILGGRLRGSSGTGRWRGLYAGGGGRLGGGIEADVTGPGGAARPGDVDGPQTLHRDGSREVRKQRRQTWWACGSRPAWPEPHVCRSGRTEPGVEASALACVAIQESACSATHCRSFGLRDAPRCPRFRRLRRSPPACRWVRRVGPSTWRPFRGATGTECRLQATTLVI